MHKWIILIKFVNMRKKNLCGAAVLPLQRKDVHGNAHGGQSNGLNAGKWP